MFQFLLSFLDNKLNIMMTTKNFWILQINRKRSFKKFLTPKSLPIKSTFNTPDNYIDYLFCDILMDFSLASIFLKEEVSHDSRTTEYKTFQKRMLF